MIGGGGEAVLFWVLAPLMVLAALSLLFARKAVHAAIAVMFVMVDLAILYIAQEASFLGVVQVVVYTGAVMMLFLFVLMLIGVDSSDSLIETLRGQRVAAMLIGLGFGVLMIAGIGNATIAVTSGATAPGALADDTNYGIEAIAELIFVRYLWAFELTGALLIAATLGAMVLAHREKFGPRLTQKELSQARFRTGINITPLPSPGVYARHNAVDVPARLPDGSPSDLSVNAILAARTLRQKNTEAPENPADQDSGGRS